MSAVWCHQTWMCSILTNISTTTELTPLEIFHMEKLSLEKVNNTEPTQAEDAGGVCWLLHEKEGSSRISDGTVAILIPWEKDSPWIAGSAHNSQRKTTPCGSDHQILLLKGVKGKLSLGISLILNE